MKNSKKYVMIRAWEIYRKNGSISFGEALRRSWFVEKAIEINAKRVAKAKEEAGVLEETDTWYGWKRLGYEVIHGSKALFKANLIWASKGPEAVYKAAFFGASQVQPAVVGG